MVPLSGFAGFSFAGTGIDEPGTSAIALCDSGPNGCVGIGKDGFHHGTGSVHVSTWLFTVFMVVYVVHDSGGIVNVAVNSENVVTG